MTGPVLLIECLPGETRAARLDGDGVLQALRIWRDDPPDPVGRLYHARVRRLVPALGAAFLDLGPDGEAFLPFGKAGPPVEGAALVVRLDRPGIDGKAPRAARAEAPDGALPDAPALLDPGPPAARRAVDALAQEGDDLVCDDADLAAALGATFDGDPAGLFARNGLEAEIDALLDPAVPLPGGGRLFIERARALTVVDVDSGGAEGNDDPQRFLAGRNLAAMAAIARQLRLRGIGGQVVIDPISLRDPGERRLLVSALKEAVANDPAGVQVLGATGLGLLELTRGRRAPALGDVLCGPDGTPSAATRAFAAVRAARAGLGSSGRPAVLVVAPEVAAALTDGPAAAAWTAQVARSGGLLSLRADADCAAPRLDRAAA